MARLTQLRIYTINKGAMEEFVEVWRTQVVPLRQQFGFEIDGGWVYANANRFVWLLSLEGTMADWEAQMTAYLESPERTQMTPNPSDYIAHMDLSMLRGVLFG